MIFLPPLPVHEKNPIDAIATIGGVARDVDGPELVGVASSGELLLGWTFAEDDGFAYDLSLGVGPGLVLSDDLQIGATIGFGLGASPATISTSPGRRRPRSSPSSTWRRRCARSAM